MNKLNVISGMPRSGSTLLCQILNMNPDFNATQTSPILDMLVAQQSVFSHSPSFKAVDRMEVYNAFGNAQKAFLESYYEELYGEDKVVFDKNRGWPLHLMKLDELLDNTDTKILWTYRNPVHVVSSMEARHRLYPLIQFNEEGGGQVSLNTLEKRVNMWCGDNGIIAAPVYGLHDAVEMLNSKRIYIVDYKELCTKTQVVMDEIHSFLGLPKYSYAAKDFKDLKQVTKEDDSTYNYKYPHDIIEGKIEYKEPEFTLPQRYIDMINERFKWLNEHVSKILEEKRPRKTRTQKKQGRENNVKKAIPQV
jgi:sulfotransferase